MCAIARRPGPGPASLVDPVHASPAGAGCLIRRRRGHGRGRQRTPGWGSLRVSAIVWSGLYNRGFPILAVLARGEMTPRPYLPPIFASISHHRAGSVRRSVRGSVRTRHGPRFQPPSGPPRKNSPIRYATRTRPRTHPPASGASASQPPPANLTHPPPGPSPPPPTSPHPSRHPPTTPPRDRGLQPDQPPPKHPSSHITTSDLPHPAHPLTAEHTIQHPRRHTSPPSPHKKTPPPPLQPSHRAEKPAVKRESLSADPPGRAVRRVSGGGVTWGRGGRAVALPGACAGVPVAMALPRFGRAPGHRAPWRAVARGVAPPWSWRIDRCATDPPRACAGAFAPWLAGAGGRRATGAPGVLILTGAPGAIGAWGVRWGVDMGGGSVAGGWGGRWGAGGCGMREGLPRRRAPRACRARAGVLPRACWGVRVYPGVRVLGGVIPLHCAKNPQILLTAIAGRPICAMLLSTGRLRGAPGRIKPAPNGRIGQ